METGRIHKKKNQHKEEEKVDLLSKLPETLILFILSFLEMQDVVKTSVLSKSWNNLWTKAYNIVLCCDNNPNDVHKMSDRDWVSSFDQTLMKCNADNIDKFSLERGDRILYWLNPYDVLDKWVKHLMARKVKILILKLSSYVAPRRIFQSSSITEMELVRLRFDVDMSFIPISLSSLKILILDTVSDVNDGFIQNILMGCPVLESFAMLNVKLIHEIMIMSPRLKSFKLDRLDNEDDEPDVVEDEAEAEHQPQAEGESEGEGEGEGEADERNRLEIRAPWLQELEIAGNFLTTNFQLVDVLCLKKATITSISKFDDHVNEKWIPMVREVLSSVSYVGELIIGSHPIQVLSLCKVLGTPSPLFNCKQVSIETCLWKFDLPGIACLLENAPHLETLFIKVLDEDIQHTYPLYQTRILFEDGSDPHLGMPIGKFLHLKNVKIDYWPSHSCHDSTDQNHFELLDFEIVEYILRSAVVLEKLVLCSSRSRCSFVECLGPSCPLQCVSRLSYKVIRTCVRLKKPSEWDINKGENMREFIFQNDASLHPTSASP